MTLGGRTKPDGTVDIPDFDHTDANALPGLATLTPEDPLAGLDDLAQQVATAGITRVRGDVMIDDRLWDPLSVGDLPITPIVVNDNLIDLLITPGLVGAMATVEWRPRTAAYQVDAQVTTTDASRCAARFRSGPHRSSRPTRLRTRQCLPEACSSRH